MRAYKHVCRTAALPTTFSLHSVDYWLQITFPQPITWRSSHTFSGISNGSWRKAVLLLVLCVLGLQRSVHSLTAAFLCATQGEKHLTSLSLHFLLQSRNNIIHLKLVCSPGELWNPQNEAGEKEGVILKSQLIKVIPKERERKHRRVSSEKILQGKGNVDFINCSSSIQVTLELKQHWKQERWFCIDHEIHYNFSVYAFERCDVSRSAP